MSLIDDFFKGFNHGNSSYHNWDTDRLKKRGLEIVTQGAEMDLEDKALTRHALVQRSLAEARNLAHKNRYEHWMRERLRPYDIRKEASDLYASTAENYNRGLKAEHSMRELGHWGDAMLGNRGAQLAAENAELRDRRDKARENIYYRQELSEADLNNQRLQAQNENLRQQHALINNQMGFDFAQNNQASTAELMRLDREKILFEGNKGAASTRLERRLAGKNMAEVVQILQTIASSEKENIYDRMDAQQKLNAINKELAEQNQRESVQAAAKMPPPPIELTQAIASNPIETAARYQLKVSDAGGNLFKVEDTVSGKVYEDVPLSYLQYLIYQKANVEDAQLTKQAYSLEGKATAPADAWWRYYMGQQ